MTKLFFLFLTLLITLTVNSQSTIFKNLYGTTFDETGNTVVKTVDKGFIMVGTRGSYTNSSEIPDIYVVKTDSNGLEEWSQNYGVSGIMEFGIDIIQASDGGFVIGGYTINPSTSDKNICVLKIDVLGNQLWYTVHNSSLWQTTYSLTESNNNEYILVGSSTHNNVVFSNNVCLTKFNSSGVFVWQKIIGSPSDGEIGRDIVKTQSGDYVITGDLYSSQYTNHFEDAFILKVDSFGNQIWLKAYDLLVLIGSIQVRDRDISNAIIETQDLGYLIAGDNLNNSSAFLIKTDINGDTLWTKVHKDYLNYECKDVKQTIDGGYVFTGTKNLGTYQDLLVARTDNNGDILWTKTYGRNQPGEYESGHSIINVSDTNFAVLGYSHGELVYLYHSEFYLILYTDTGLVNYVGLEDYFDIQNNHISLFPNPASAELHVVPSNDQPLIKAIYIINSMGIRQDVDWDDSIVDISNLITGLYFVIVEFENNTVFTKKIIKQ